MFARFRKTSLIISSELHEKITNSCANIGEDEGEIVKVRSVPLPAAERMRRSRLHDESESPKVTTGIDDSFQIASGG